MTALRRHQRVWLGLTGAALAASVFAQEQGPRPSFRTGVQLVRIDVSVLDDKRQPVRGLQASDFIVLEDGQPRPIRSFTAVDHGPAATGAPAVAPIPAHEVATNQNGDDRSRLIFILMDRSIPQERPMIMARQIADAAVDAMAPGDLAAIVTTGTGDPQNLTSDRARLHKTIAASDWSQTVPQAQIDDPNLALIRAAGLLDPATDGACLCGLCVMDTIARIANEVRDVPRRKILLFVGSNLVVQVGTDAWNRGLSCDKLARDSREKLFDALGTSGLTVHAIDPQGLASVGPATRVTVPNGIPNRDGRVLNEQLTQERTDFIKAQGNLDILPELTGGRTVLNSNEPFRMIPEVLRESDAYYLLAFEPIEAKGDVRRSIEVKVARKGVKVHTARSVSPPGARDAAGSPAAGSPLDRALTALLPDASLPLSMSVASFAGADRDHAYVGVTLDASAFVTGSGSIPIAIAISASDERGRHVAGAHQNGTVEVPPANAGTTAAPLVELQTYLTLPPGDYELRAAVMNAESRATSSVFTHVTVPSFDSARVMLSDVVLGTRENAGSLPDGAPAIPIVPTTTRVLGAGVPAWAFLRVYRQSDTDAEPVSIDTSVLDSDGRRVIQQSLPGVAFDGRTADVRLGLPLKTLAAGNYVLRIQAQQSRAETSRTVAFVVEQAQPSFTQEHSPELDAALAAVARYIDQYERRISAIGAEEQYDQAVDSTSSAVVLNPLASPAAVPSRAAAAESTVMRTTVTRRTRANIMTLSRGALGWVSFRDVFEVDGRPVRDREERLSRILQDVRPESLEQARQIAVESARYNLNAGGTRIDRTINVPMTALMFLRGANQSRSAFRLGRPERVGGVPCVTLQFIEQGLPRLIRTNDNAAAQGTFWIDMGAGGRVIRTELRVQSAGGSGPVRAKAVVIYAQVDTLNLWVPMEMNETYDVPSQRQTVTAHATYSDFREFKVTTSEGIK